jgi:non-specific serine/threonine protein kinase/serine/threonine-protein kinase
MSSGRFRRAKELFATVKDLDREEVPHFLASACGDDSWLRREVALLLAVDDELESAEAPPPRLESVGHFQVIRMVGEGGMGEVWEAEQVDPIRRRVAIKLVKWGMDTREVLARFEAERQALAMMNHANIASVHEAGASDDGRSYFAMEFVDGVSITDYSDDSRLTISERLHLFLDVCSGVQHAHEKGVIHRDLKPSNVLVTVQDGEAVPKIIDFGVAKAISKRLTERTLATELGHWIGTPEYMSPEQAGTNGNDVDTRSDVYSLGVLLYELITGRPPVGPDDLRDASLEEIRRRICDEEPLRPSTRVTRMGTDSDEVAANRRTDVASLRRALRGDLDWIVLKALEKEKERRYGSPSELAADIRRHLSHEPVQAGPPGILYRAGKFVRRNRLAVTAAALVAVAVVVAVFGTTYGLIRARNEAETAQRVSAFLESMILDLNPRSRSGYAASPREIVDRGVARIQAELADQPLEVARLMTALGVTYTGLGELELAKPLLENAAAIRLEHLGDRHPDYATSLFHLGNLMTDLDRDERASAYHIEALRIREKILPPEDPLVVSSLERVMISSYWTGDCETALSLSRKIFNSVDPEEIVGRPDVESAVVTSGTAAVLCGDQDLARRMLSWSDTVEGKFSGPENLGLARTLINYAGFLDRMGRPEDALPHAVRGLEIWDRLDGPRDRSYAASLDSLAGINLHLGRLEPALELYERVLVMMESHEFPTADHAYTLYNSACVLAGLGNSGPALERLREAVDAGLAQAINAEDQVFDDLRGDQEFEALVAEVQGRLTSGPT